jgi:membrane protein
MGERQLGLIAAGVAFFAMLAVFPAIAALIALVGFWADPGVVQETLDLAAEFVPPEAHAILADQTARLIGTTSRTLGWASVVALLGATWSARRGVGALAQGLNAIYGGRRRGGLRDMALALALTAVLIGVGVVAVATILLMPLALALATPFLPPASPLPQIAELLRWAVAVTALVVGLGLFYRYGPNRPAGLRSSFLSPGLWLAMVVWGGASIGFTLFLANFGTYNEVYGSIGAAIALLMWFYISAYAVLIGGALNYALEKPQASPALPAA